MIYVMLDPTPSGWIAYDDALDRFGTGDSQAEALESYSESFLSFVQSLTAMDPMLGPRSARALALLEGEALLWAS